jgi:hypothetical protein
MTVKKLIEELQAKGNLEDQVFVDGNNIGSVYHNGSMISSWVTITLRKKK